MQHLVNNVVKPIAVAIAAVVLGAMHQGCQPVKDASSDPNVQYTLDTAKCVADAKTPEESRQCRAKVNWMYGLCPDTENVGLPCQ